jgi:hypothetical protein
VNSNKKFLILGMIFLLLVILSFSIVSSYRTTTNTRYYVGGIHSSFSPGNADLYNADMCQEGTDFILQIDPAGCNPPVVRSDLLEEQDVPVFCPIQAIKINPIIEVQSIRGMTFSGDYSQEVSNVGFYGSRSALGFNDDINSFNYQNVGYAVIWIRNNPNESSMPDFVEGKLKATITYDLEEAFGVRTSQMYLPVISDDEWNRQKVKYYFWDGRGYIRAEDITPEGAKIAIYSDQSNTFVGSSSGDKRKIGSVFLSEGEKSNVFYLPGLGCFASLRLQLEDIGAASDFATLKINSEYYDISDNEYFLDNQCRILNINKNGAMKSVKIRCSEDNLEGNSFMGYGGSKTFNLVYSPKVNFEVDGKVIEDVQLGDKLYESKNGDFTVYLGYLDSNQYAEEKEETLKAYLISLSDADVQQLQNKNKLDSEVIEYYENIAEYEDIYESEDKGRIIELAQGFEALFLKKWDFFVKGREYETIKVNGQTEFEGENVRFLGYSTGKNAALADQAREDYERAVGSFDEVINKYISEKYPTDEEITVAEKSIRDKINLAIVLGQNYDAVEFCEDFASLYPNAEEIEECSNLEALSNEGISTQSVFVGGKLREISLKGVQKPSIADYSVEVQVSGHDSPFILRKDQPVYFNAGKNSERGSGERDIKEEFTISQPLEEEFYFAYSEERGWLWSFDREVWMESLDIKVNKGDFKGQSPLRVNQLIIDNLKGKEYEEGRTILLTMKTFVLGRESRHISDLYFVYNFSSSSWTWSPDLENWMPVSEIEVSGGEFDGKEPVDINKITIFELIGKNYEEGKEVLLKSKVIDLDNSELYFLFNQTSEEWKWAYDFRYWKDLSNTEIEVGSLAKLNLRVIESLKKVNSFEEGLKILGRNIAEFSEEFEESISESKTLSKKEYIRLVSIDNENKATIHVNVEGTSTLTRTREWVSGKDWTFEKGVTQRVNEQYAITVKNINFKQYAKVRIVPDLKFSRSEANMSFKIGIEKRGIQLSPEVAQKKVDKLNKTIAQWESISNTLGTVVQTMKTACLVTGTALTIENLLENSGGEAIARQEVMTSKGGWNEICSEYEKADCDGKPCASKEQCFIKNANTIEKEVEDYKRVMDRQNDEIGKIQEQPGYTSSSGFLGEKVVDTRKATLSFADKVKERIGGTIDSSEKGNDPIDLNEFEGLLDETSFDSRNYDFNDLKEIDLYYELMNNADSTAEKEKYEERLYAVVYDVQKNSEAFVEAKTYESEKGEGIAKVITTSKDTRVIPVEEYKKYSETKYFETSKFNLYSNPIEGSIDSSELNIFFIKDSSNGNDYKILYDDDGVVIRTQIKGDVEGTYGDVEAGNPNPLNLKFKKYDQSTYLNPYKDYEVRYYEAEPYRGLPALIPMSLTQGWYVYVKQTLPIGGNIASYDLSGAVRSYWICNVGDNGREEFNFGIGDDICEMVNEGINQPVTFPGLDSKEASRLISHAKKTIEYVSRQYDSAKKTKRVEVSLLEGGSRVLPVGEPETNNPSAECTNFMSVKDCQLLFNVCDPVICPTSRCDLGGAYPVKDVVQSGIIGSIALCLPNAKNGIYVPVCLTGVKAGIDGWLSVTKSYKDCLEQSIETGETVGICDEVHSIYMCEFMWRQALPVAKLAIPKILSAIARETSRGGGEYLGVQSAWENAQNSVSYLTEYYAANSYKAFKFRNTDEVGSAVCKNYVSLTYPEGSNLLDIMTQADSPAQYHGRFDEIPFTTATNPPISQYKVFYHIFAGNDRGAYYGVYLRGGEGSSYYQTVSGKIVASGYISKGGYATDTVDFTAPSGLDELCISVNGQEECDFGTISTSFALDYVEDQYLIRQGNNTDITSESECISGSADFYQLLNPNIQEGVGNVIDPQIYNEGIVRICSTDNPGSGSDPSYGLSEQRWIEVGYCGNKEIKCWLDRGTIADAFEFETSANKLLEGLSNEYLNKVFNDPSKNFLDSGKFKDEIDKINGMTDYRTRLEKIADIFDRVFYTNEKAHLLWMRGDILGMLAREGFEPNEEEDCSSELKREYFNLLSSFSDNPDEKNEILMKSYEMVLENPCLIDRVTRDEGWSLLHLFAANSEVGTYDRTKSLLDLGANVDAQVAGMSNGKYPFGSNVLHIATISKRDYNYINLLLIYGADSCLKNGAGFLPSDYVKGIYKDKSEIISLFESANCEFFNGETCDVGERTHQEKIKYLESKGIETIEMDSTQVELIYREVACPVFSEDLEWDPERCSREGGKCLNVESYKCFGNYETLSCPGGNNIQCCYDSYQELWDYNSALERVQNLEGGYSDYPNFGFVDQICKGEYCVGGEALLTPEECYDIKGFDPQASVWTNTWNFEEDMEFVSNRLLENYEEWKKKNEIPRGEVCEVPPSLDEIINNNLYDLNERVVDSTNYFVGKPIPDEKSGHCFDAATWVYEAVKVGTNCKYSDKIGKKYNVKNNEIITNSSVRYVVNPSSCERVGGHIDLDESQKLDLLEGGDMIDFYYLDNQHTAIFIEWVDKDSYKAKLFDWIGLSSDVRVYRFYEDYISDDQHPVYMIRGPYVS